VSELASSEQVPIRTDFDEAESTANDILSVACQREWTYVTTIDRRLRSDLDEEVTARRLVNERSAIVGETQRLWMAATPGVSSHRLTDAHKLVSVGHSLEPHTQRGGVFGRAVRDWTTRWVALGEQRCSCGAMYE
jgi:hypothetical protein